jgi:gamma-glutamyltranspeptidase
VASTETAGAPLGPVSLESDGWSETDADALRALGHDVSLVEPRTPLMGWAQVIRRASDGSYSGGADPRADSAVAQA